MPLGPKATSDSMCSVASVRARNNCSFSSECQRIDAATVQQHGTMQDPPRDVYDSPVPAPYMPAA